VFASTAFAQSPHGEEFKMDCAACHTSQTWKMAKANMTFDHNTTHFRLTGQHQNTDCINCHKTLLFNEAKTECSACHTDMHQNTLGPDCARCHDTREWIIKNIIPMHQMSRFPLLGNHAVLDCSACHKSASNLQFQPLGVECIDCHRSDYLATTSPNHQMNGYPTNCLECHDVIANNWNLTSFNHGSFPLTGGHNIECAECHAGGIFKKISTDCLSCHQAQFNSAKDHVALKFPTDCRICHNMNNWLGATFDHNTTIFPLTGAHTTVDCVLCHTAGYAGTPADCNSCHQTNYNSTTNPNHKALGLSVICTDCHTTNAGWQPVTFPIHNNYYALTGAHATIANNCVACHKGVYTPISTTCYSCHASDYNNTTNPAHAAAQFPTTCETCHTVTAWAPSTFNHTSYFPITSGRHNVSCSQCHTSPSNYANFSCVTASCHGNAHNQNQGSAGCYRCHPTGSGGG
jgi:hypothetical protein